MNWNIIIPIVIFITDAILAWFCYTLGCRTVKPIQDNNQKFWEERELLKKDINTLNGIHESLVNKITDYSNEINSMQDQLFSVTKQKELIEESNKQAQEFITQSKQLAKEKADAVYQKRLLELEKNFKDSKEYYESTIKTLTEYVKTEEEQLKSLKETRAAVIEAAQQEKHIQENKDYYCLILPQEELGDVNILRGVAKRISKPRAIGMCIWSNYYLPLAKEKIPKILGKNIVCGIYKITNLETEECYIGQSVDVKKRIYDHLKAACGVDTPKDNLLYQAMKKYGIENFSIELLQECTSQELNQKEKYFIELYQSQIYGYNKTSGNKTRVGIDK